MRKNPNSCDCTGFELTSQRQKVSRLLPTEPPGRPCIRSSKRVDDGSCLPKKILLCMYLCFSTHVDGRDVDEMAPW